MKSTMCTGMEEIRRNLKDVGIVYEPPLDGDEHGSLVWQHCYDRAREFSRPYPNQPIDPMRGMEFGPEIPCDIEGDTVYLFVIHDDLQVDVKDMTTYQAMQAITGFIAKSYWADAIGNYGEND